LESKLDKRKKEERKRQRVVCKNQCCRSGLSQADAIFSNRGITGKRVARIPDILLANIYALKNPETSEKSDE